MITQCTRKLSKFCAKIIQKILGSGISTIYRNRINLLFHQNYILATNQLITSKTRRDFLCGRGKEGVVIWNFSRKKTSFFFLFVTFQFIFTLFSFLAEGRRRTYTWMSLIDYLLRTYADKIHNGKIFLYISKKNQ